MNLINLLVTVLVLGLVFSILYWLIGQINLPPPFRSVAVAVLSLIIVVLLLGMLFGGIDLPSLRLR
jgi:hypothetical protein